MYPHREVFTNAPLALVTAEIRFTDAARLRQQPTRDEIAIALEDRFPFAEPFQRTDMNLMVGGPPLVQERQGVLLKSASSTEALTLMSESLTYETTTYAQFEDLLEVVTVAVDALVQAKVRPAMRRVGLRYIDEVRVRGNITDARQWAPWIDGRILGHLDVGPSGFEATAAQTASTFDLGEGRGLNVRYAALNQGPIVVPQFLTRPVVQSGPFFVLDFDGFHDFTGRDAVRLSSDVVRESLSAVHVPCGNAFQRSITDKARKLFRGFTS